jgi:hypothetical protein
MDKFSASTMRDPTDDAGSFASYVDALDERKKGNLDPSNEKHAPLLNLVAQQIASGSLDETRVQKLMRMNPKAAPVWASALDMARPKARRQEILSEYFAPESSVKIPGRSEVGGSMPGNFSPYNRNLPAKADVQGATLAALNSGDIELAKELGYGKSGQSETPFAKIDPKDFTRESVAKFQRSQNYADLMPTDKTKNDPEKAFQYEQNLRGEFRNLSKTFMDVRDAFGRIQESSKDPSPAGDIALIFNFMKMLDPGSTVREGEFATAQNAGSIPDNIMAMYNKAIKGEGRLAENIRTDFVKRSESLYKRQLSSHQNLEKQYRALSQRVGADPNAVVLDFSLQDMPAPPVVQPEETKPPTTAPNKRVKFSELP